MASNLLPTLNFPNPPNLFATVRLCKYHRAQCPALHSTAHQIKSRLLLLASLVKHFYMNIILIEYRRMIKWEKIYLSSRRQDMTQTKAFSSIEFIYWSRPMWLLEKKKLGFSINWMKKSEISQRLCSGVLGAGVSGGGLGVFAADHPMTGHRVWKASRFLIKYGQVGCHLKRSCKMWSSRVAFRSIGPSSQKLWPNLIFSPIAPL